jgi:hypothetical protein
MARNISAHRRYRLAAKAFAAVGGLGCVGAMFGQHAMALLVIGMMNLAASMLMMSLRPPKGAGRSTVSQGCDRCSRGRQTAELTVRTLRVDGASADSAEPAVELMADAGGARPRERKSRIWSI